MMFDKKDVKEKDNKDETENKKEELVHEQECTETTEEIKTPLISVTEISSYNDPEHVVFIQDVNGIRQVIPRYMGLVTVYGENPSCYYSVLIPTPYGSLVPPTLVSGYMGYYPSDHVFEEIREEEDIISPNFSGKTTETRTNIKDLKVPKSWILESISKISNTNKTNTNKNESDIDELIKKAEKELKKK